MRIAPTFTVVIALMIPIQGAYADMNKAGDLQRYVMQIGWKAHASVIERKEQTKSWYKDKMYDDSIYNVIAQALADCATLNAEYRTARIKKSTIVEFDVKPTVEKPYTPENWNAVVLWNYLAEAIWGYLCQGIYDYGDKCIDKVGEKIKEHYRNIKDITDHIDTAVSDIKSYANCLELYDFIRDYKNLNKSWLTIKYKEKQLQVEQWVPGVYVNASSNPNEISATLIVWDAFVVVNSGKAIQTKITIEINDGEIAKCYTGSTEAQLSSALHAEKPEKLTEEQKFERKLIDEKQLKNITNYGKNDISCGNCYLNSTLQALHASEAMRKTVKALSDIKDVERRHGLQDISPILQEIFEAIEDGTMNKNDKKRNEHIIKYENAIERLANCLELIQADILMQYTNGVETFTEEYYSTKLQGIYNSETKQKHYLRKNSKFKAIDILSEILYALDKEIVDKGIMPIIKMKEYVWKDDCTQGYWRHSENPGQVGVNGIPEDKNDATDRINKINKIYTEGEPEIVIQGGQSQVAKRYEYPPKLFILNAFGDTGRKIKYPEEITLTNIYGTSKKYKLISLVDTTAYLGGHFVAEVRTKQGWKIMDDCSGKATGENINRFYNETPCAENTNYRVIVMYEQVN